MESNSRLLGVGRPMIGRNGIALRCFLLAFVLMELAGGARAASLPLATSTADLPVATST